MHRKVERMNICIEEGKVCRLYELHCIGGCDGKCEGCTWCETPEEVAAIRKEISSHYREVKKESTDIRAGYITCNKCGNKVML